MVYESSSQRKDTGQPTGAILRGLFVLFCGFAIFKGQLALDFLFMSESQQVPIIQIERLVAPYSLIVMIMGLGLAMRYRFGLVMAYSMVVVTFSLPILVMIDSDPPSLLHTCVGVTILSVPGLFAFGCMKYYHDRQHFFRPLYTTRH